MLQLQMVGAAKWKGRELNPQFVLSSHNVAVWLNGNGVSHIDEVALR